VFVATVGLYDISVREQANSESRVRALIGHKNALERMTRELRDAVAVRYNSSEVLDAQISAAGRWVRYDCSGSTCRRAEGPSQGVFDGEPKPVVADVHSADFQLFSNVPGVGLQPDYINPSYVQITLKVRVRGAENPITLSDGFNLRNLTRPT